MSVREMVIHLRERSVRWWESSDIYSKLSQLLATSYYAIAAKFMLHRIPLLWSYQCTVELQVVELDYKWYASARI